MIHAKPFGEQAMMRGDHVVVVVLREMRVQAVAGLRGFSVADAIRKNDVVAPGIQKLARAEKFVCKNRGEELMAGAAGTVQNQDRVGDAALRVLCRLSQCCVMQAQLWQRFAGAELEILYDIVAFGRGGCAGLLCLRVGFAEENNREQTNEKT